MVVITHRPCMNDGILWKRKVVISDTHSCVCVCVMGLISARALIHRHTLWLSLLFNYVYMGQWRRQLSFLKSCKATSSISCLSSYTVYECVCVSRELRITELSHPYWGRISRPHCHCDSQPSLFIGCLEVWVMQHRWCCSAGIQTCLHPWLLRPLIHLLCLCMCVCGECDAITAEVLPAVWLRNLFSLSLSHTHSHTTPSFHIIERGWSDIWYEYFLLPMYFGYLIRSIWASKQRENQE